MRGVIIMLNQLRICRATRLWQSLFCSLVALLLVNGLAWGAGDANKLLAVSVDSNAATPTVLIETAEPVGYRYTVYDSFEPTRVVIDFPGMELTDIAETVSVDQGTVQEVRISGFNLSSGQLTRVEILLAEGTEYQVNLDAKEFRVAFATEIDPAKQAVTETISTEPAPPAQAENITVDASQDASVIRNISVSTGKAVLQTNGKVGKFQFFTLGNPPRLVVDVYGLKPAFKERSFGAEGGFKQVRVGTYNDKTRLVFDASENVVPEHLVEGRTTDIMVSWGNVQPLPDMEDKPALDVKPAVVEVPEKTQLAPLTTEKPVSAPVVAEVMDSVSVESIDFVNADGRSVIAVVLSGPAQVLDPVEEGNLVRFEIVNTSISRALRRTIDASAFPSAVTSVTPYTVTTDDHQNVRIAVDLKSPVAYALEQDGNVVRLVIDDAAYAEQIPPAVSQVEVFAPVLSPDSKPGSDAAAGMSSFAPTTSTVSADDMAAEAARYTGETITLVFDSANVRSILQLIGDVSGMNILASSDVKGDVTLRLIDVPWDQALDLILDTTNLGKVQEGNVLRIMPKDKIREIEQAEMKEQVVAIEEGVLETKVFAISYASVDDMKNFLGDIKSERGSIIADSRNKQLIVRDAAAVIEQMAEMIGHIDKPERQVMIEARIVEANTNFAHDLGVKWLFDYEDSTGVKGDANRNMNITDAALGLGGSFVLNPVSSAGIASQIAIGALNGGLDIDVALSALESSGEAKVISTPRVTTLNGEKAVISQGTKIPYATVGDSGTNVEFESAELKLEVTPEINPDGSIILDINASSSAVGSAVPVAGGLALSIDAKEAKTKVLVRDGQTTVIGGIFIEDERDSNTGVPVLKDIPIIGHLFKSSSVAASRKELLIFITPRIVVP